VRAAECVISAASAALLWAGPDNHGVLAKVAAADPDRMVSSRMSARLHAKHVRELPELAEYERAVGERAGRPGSRIVLVGYPAWMVPQWASRVSAALDEARAAARQRFPGFEPGSRGWAEFVRVYALMAVEQSGIEPLSLDGIEDAAQMVQYFSSVADVAGRRGKLGSTE
jgi:hypothetical protein